MTEKRTAVDENRFVFTSEVNYEELPEFIAVHWTGLGFAPSDAFLGPLRAYLRPRHEVSEVWIIFPSDLRPLFETLRQSARLRTDTGDLVPRVYRFFSFGLDGEWLEEWPDTSPAVNRVTDSMMDAVIADGLRQLFRDTDSLATAAAGFHFAHPSGSHSARFIRSSQSVARLHHTYYVAMALTRKLRPLAKDLTVWVDTASISAVGYAYADLLRRVNVDGERRVETFGGYDGLESSLRPAPHDIVIVSGSTSGSLATRVVASKNMSVDNVITLFFLGKELAPENRGLVLCDLTNRDAEIVPSVRDARLQPYKTFKAERCEICASGSGTIQLEGDSFFPAASQLDLRMPTFADRPLGGKTGPRAQITDFDGSSYFNDLFGLKAIAAPAGTPVDGSPHGVSTRLGHLLREDYFAERVGRAADRAIGGTKPVSVVISLLDDDSTELGRLLAKRYLGDGSGDNFDVSPDIWREWKRARTDTLGAAADGGTVLVCAAVVGSGRRLTSISRELRKVAGGFDIRYFVTVAHPESSTTWDLLTKTLKRVSATETSELSYMWRLPRDPKLPGVSSPWARERQTLTKVATWLAEQADYSSLIGPLEARLLELNSLDESKLFVGATGVIAPVNKNFALWPFDWAEHEVKQVPTHAEIYATVAHLLYESRHRNPTVESRSITTRRHGYALHPAVFDRFNDPVIQAAILRAAEPGELHYTTDTDASRAVSDLLWFILTNMRTEAGDASYEFVLALCEGCDNKDAPGMRLDNAILRSRLDQLEQSEYGGLDLVNLQASSPHVRALLLYLRHRIKMPA